MVSTSFRLCSHARVVLNFWHIRPQKFWTVVLSFGNGSVKCGPLTRRVVVSIHFPDSGEYLYRESKHLMRSQHLFVCLFSCSCGLLRLRGNHFQRRLRRGRYHDSAARSIAVSVTPTAMTVQIGQSLPLTATVANDPASKGVKWTVPARAAVERDMRHRGAASSASGVAVSLHAPATVPSPAR